MNKYPKKTIARACALVEKGVPLREIMRRTGIKSTSTIQYRCDPEYRKRQDDRGREWRAKNPKKWLEISKRARDAQAKRAKRKKA